MSRILALIRADAQHVFTNVISLVVCVGMIVVPSFYAWFNIAGSWDPYGNTHNLRVALVNADQGYKGDLMPLRVNMGERIVSQLRASKSIGYVVTDQDEAVEGVSSGEYYAAIVIPESFSHDMITGLADASVHPTVRYYYNEKRNAIAAIVTEKASSAARQAIDESFVGAAVEVGAGVMDELGDYLDDDRLAGIAADLDQALGDSSSDLRQTSDNLRSYAQLVASARTLAGSADSALGTSLSSASGVGDDLRETAGAVRDVDAGLDSASASVDEALSKASSSMDGVSGSIDEAFAAANDQADDARAGLQKAKDAVDAQHAALQQLSDQLAGTDSLVSSLEAQLDVGSTEWTYVHSLKVTLPGVNKRVQDALQSTQDLSDALQKAIDDIGTSQSDAEASRAELQRLVDQARSSVTDVHASYSGSLGATLQGMAGGIEGAASVVDSIGSQLSDTAVTLSTTAADTDQALAGLADSLGEAADKLDSSVDDLDDLRGRVRAALDSGDADQLRKIFSADAASLAEFIAEPVELDRTAVFPVANNGSAMAPFYTTLSIWIGAVVLCALVRVTPSREAQERVGAKPRHAYFGRLAFFLAIGLMQTVLIVLGDLFFLGIQCLHPWLFALACCVASVVFVNVVYALTAAFGDVGKAIAVVLMVIQVAGSGGTFPVQMLPEAFQRVYPFLPFVHAETCLRAAIAGLYGADFWASLAVLASFLAPALVLGLLLRKPVVRLNHWMERQLESTKVM